MPKKKKRRRRDPSRFLSMVILIIAVLVIFEGKLLINIFSRETIQSQLNTQLEELFAEGETETQEETEEPRQTETQTEPQATVAVKSSAIVPEQSTPVDDSYFSDAVFIGDSRVEGFRNQSGITQGTFLTGVGMETVSVLEKPYISTPNGMVTVPEAMSGTDYGKIYIMLGTNDLGEPDFNDFKDHYRTCLTELKKLAPNAIIYVMSVAYVEEEKALANQYGSYVNNENIDAVNEKILELCEEEGYHYLDINEALSDGNGSLITDATSDGIHLYDTYCKIWLDYLKTHYVTEEESQTQTEDETESDGLSTQPQSDSQESQSEEESSESETQSDTSTL